MLTVALLIALAWLVAIPAVVLATTEIGWRLGERRRALRRSSRGTVVLFPESRLGAGAGQRRGATGTAAR